MHKYATTLLLAGQSSLATEWVQKSSYPGLPRHHPITFSNSTHGFVIGGNTYGYKRQKADQVMVYDPESNSWTEKAHFPGTPRGFAYGAVFANSATKSPQTAYVGFGVSRRRYHNDLWSYDTVNDVWKELSPCPCAGRRHPAFLAATRLDEQGQVKNSIYVGLGDGRQGNMNDFWRYDIEDDRWVELPRLPSIERHHPYHFEIRRENSAQIDVFVGLGHSYEGIERDFFKFDTELQQWTNSWDFVSIDELTGKGTTEARVAGTELTACNRGFVLSGDGDDHGPMASGEFHVFDEKLGTWSALPPHPGYSRWAPGSFAIGSKVYFTSGYDRVMREVHNDLWEFDLAETGVCDSRFLESVKDLSTV